MQNILSGWWQKNPTGNMKGKKKAKAKSRHDTSVAAGAEPRV